MKPSLMLTILAFLVLCVVIPYVHGYAALFGVVFSVPGHEFDLSRATMIGNAVFWVSAVARFWHWWDIFAYRGPKLGSDYVPREAGKCLVTISAIHLVALPMVLIAAFCVGVVAGNNGGGNVEISVNAFPRGERNGFSLLYVYPLIGFLLCRWFAKVEGPGMPDRGIPLRAGSGDGPATQVVQ